MEESVAEVREEVDLAVEAEEKAMAVVVVGQDQEADLVQEVDDLVLDLLKRIIKGKVDIHQIVVEEEVEDVDIIIIEEETRTTKVEAEIIDTMKMTTGMQIIKITITEVDEEMIILLLRRTIVIMAVGMIMIIATEIFPTVVDLLGGTFIGVEETDHVC